VPEIGHESIREIVQGNYRIVYALLEDWDLCRQLKPPKPIPPLE